MKKVKIPLEMENEVKVRSIEELRENFSITKIYEHYQSGKLQSWLERWYYDDILKSLQEITYNEETFCEDMCKIFAVECSEFIQAEWDEFLEQKNSAENRIRYINTLFEEAGVNIPETISDFNMIAINQIELDMLLENGNKKPYICTREKLTIPLKYKDIAYVGLNNPEIELESSDVKQYVHNNIELIGVCFKEEHYYTELKTRKSFPTELKGIYSPHTHKGKFYNGIFYGFTAYKIIICKENGMLEEKAIGEIVGNTAEAIIALDVDEQKIGILGHIGKYIYTVYEISQTDYSIIKQYSVDMQRAYQDCFYNKENIISLNIKDKTVTLGLGYGHYSAETCFPRYLIINYETQRIEKQGRFSICKEGGYRAKEYSDNIFLLSARDRKIISSKDIFNGNYCIPIKRRNEK